MIINIRSPTKELIIMSRINKLPIVLEKQNGKELL